MTLRTLAPVRPYADIRDDYAARLGALVEEMHRSLLRWLRAAYRRSPPEMAQDDSPARPLGAVLRGLGRRWLRRWSSAAPELAEYFATAVARRSETALRSSLRRHGISVRFRRTRAMNDVMQSVVQENVSLIRSIPQQMLTQVEGIVMRSVQAGRDLASLTEALEQQFGVARRRAELIARDQNNKASAMLSRVRQQEAGITEAIWIHSAGGKAPRPSHVRAGREKARFSLAEGWWDPDEKKYVLPGELINCRCVSRPVVSGFAA